MSTQRLLGIDFGSKRVGIALSDEAQQFAIPKMVLPNDKNLANAIGKICDEENVGKIVIGESKDHDMKDNAIMGGKHGADAFAADLTVTTGLPIDFELEFMSSVQAARAQGETDMLDASAAAILLQSYLDAHRTDGNYI